MDHETWYVKLTITTISYLNNIPVNHTHRMSQNHI